MLPCPYKRSWQWKLSRVHQQDYKNRAWGRIWGKVSLYTCNLLSDLAQPKHKSFRINVCQQSISMREFSYFSKNPLRGLLFRYSNLNKLYKLMVLNSVFTICYPFIHCSCNFLKSEAEINWICISISLKDSKHSRNILSCQNNISRCKFQNTVFNHLGESR